MPALIARDPEGSAPDPLMAYLKLRSITNILPSACHLYQGGGLLMFRWDGHYTSVRCAYHLSDLTMTLASAFNSRLVCLVEQRLLRSRPASLGPSDNSPQPWLPGMLEGLGVKVLDGREISWMECLLLGTARLRRLDLKELDRLIGRMEGKVFYQ